MNSNAAANLATIVSTYHGADVRTSLRTRTAPRTLTVALVSARLDRVRQTRRTA